MCLGFKYVHTVDDVTAPTAFALAPAVALTNTRLRELELPRLL